MSREVAVLACALGVFVAAVGMVSEGADEPKPAADGSAGRAEPATTKGRGKVQSDAAPREKVTLEQSLEQSVSLDYDGVPLKDVLDDIKVRCGVPIYLDIKALDDASIPPDKAITFGLGGIPLRSALRYMLDAIDLTYIVDHDVLWITTTDKAKAIITTRVYDIRDLLATESNLDDSGDNDSAIVKAIITCVAPETWSTRGGKGSICLVPAVKAIVATQSGVVHGQIAQLLADLRAHLPAEEKAAQNDRSPVMKIYRLLPSTNSAQVASADAERYVAAVRHLVEPKSWTDETAYIAAVPGAIAVRNSPAVQARVKRLLEELGAIGNEKALISGPTAVGTNSTLPAKPSPGPAPTTKAPTTDSNQKPEKPK